MRAGRHGEAARALLTSARVHYYQGRADEARAQTEAALALARESADAIQQGTALGFLGYLLVSGGRSAEGLAALRESVMLHEALGDRMGLHTTLDYMVNAQIMRGEFQAASATLERKQALASAIGFQTELAYGQVNLALVALERGRYVEADRQARDAVQTATRLNVPIALAFALLEEAVAAARLGQAARAAKLAAEAEQKAEAMGNQYLLSELLPLRVGLSLFWGDGEEARRYLDQLTAIAGQEGAGTLLLEGGILGLEQRHAEAVPVFERARDVAMHAAADGQRLGALVGLARAHIGLEQWEDADRIGTEALQLAERLGADGRIAEAHALLGEVLLAFGRPGARGHFQAMANIAEATDATLLQAEALFGLAAAAPYHADAAGFVSQAQSLLEAFAAEVDAPARARFLAVPERRRVLEGNHIAFSLSRYKPRDTGPLPPGMWKMM
jgi:tetratricopeptide (TPR) repeat protein